MMLMDKGNLMIAFPGNDFIKNNSSMGGYGTKIEEKFMGSSLGYVPSS